MRKKCFFLIPLCLVLLLGLFFSGATLYLRVEYNYQVESIADCWTNFWNQPDCYYAEQGIEYTQVDNGLIFRFDRVLLYGEPVYHLSAGRATPLGVSYVMFNHLDWKMVASAFALSKEFARYEDTFVQDLCYTQYAGKIILALFSNEIPTDNSGREPFVTLADSRANQYGTYETYLFPEHLTADYVITCEGISITGAEIQELMDR